MVRLMFADDTACIASNCNLNDLILNVITGVYLLENRPPSWRGEIPADVIWGGKL